jgi:hypothetical protein
VSRCCDDHLNPLNTCRFATPQRLAAEGAVASVGSRGDSYDNAMAESIIGLSTLALSWLNRD